MSEEHFRVVYDGEAVADGEMEVGQLAPSLLALGKLVETMDAMATGEIGRVRVKVRADVLRGSFDIGLALDFAHSVKAWLYSPAGAATGTLLGLLGIDLKSGGKGLIQAVRWLRGRQVTKRTVLEDGNVSIETSDGDALALPPAVARAVDDPAVRQQLEKFTDPLRGDGLDAIQFEHDGQLTDRIGTEEASAFKATAGADPTSQAHFTATYQIKRLYFEPGKKWRLSNGAQTILAEITDTIFWERVRRAETAFTADDYLVCDVRMDQWLSPAGLRTEYVVERVMEHIPAPKQPRFPGT